MSTSSLLIDNIAFAKRNERISGALSLADCPRLSELVASQISVATNAGEIKHDDAIHFVLNGETDALGRYFLHLSLNVSLTTCCQRCLEMMPLNVSLNFDYLIGDEGLSDDVAEEAEAADEYDLQPASPAMDLRTLIEDEMIMALPIAPVHEHDCGSGRMQSGDKTNPFAVLKGLIKS